MTRVFVCLLAGMVPLLWPSRRRPIPLQEPSPRWDRPARTRWVPLTRNRDPDPSDDVADALVLIALGLRAGLPLTGALDHVRAGASGTVGSDLAAVVAALRWGLPVREAWSFAGSAWRPAATATHLSEQTGAAAAELLEGAAARIREQGERARERAAARAGVLLVLPLGLGFLPAFACTAVVPLVVTLASTVLAGPS